VTSAIERLWPAWPSASGLLGTLRGLIHAAGVSPTMADWRRMFEVDLVGTALVVDALRPSATEGSAAVCFASSAAHLIPPSTDPRTDALLDRPLDPDFLDRLSDAYAEIAPGLGVLVGQAGGDPPGRPGGPLRGEA